MKRILTLLLAIVMVVSAGLISFNVGVKVGEERAKVNLEVPTPSTPGQPKPSESQPLPSSPGDSRPGQTKPDDPTPTQPVPCSHEFVGGTCKHCGALKPTEGLGYTLNEDGQSYTLTRGWIDTYYKYSVVIADVYEGLPVTAIGESAFCQPYGNYYLTSVHIPDTITTIGDSAFSNCDNLAGVNIPDSVTTIGDSAFSGCDKFSTISIGKNVTSIGMRAFYNCNNLTTIYWSEKTVSVGGEAFGDCEQLGNIHICNIASWCESVFINTAGPYGIVKNPLQNGAKLYLNEELITDLVIPEGVTRIGENAFYGYGDLKSVTIPGSVTTVGDYAFSSCDALTTVTMGNGVTTIGDSAFWSCDALTSVSIPDSITHIANDAFGSCDNLTYKRYDTAYYLGNEGNPYSCLVDAIGSDISGCNIHKDTKTIASSAFYECGSISSIMLPDGLWSIGDYAFYGTGLTAITIPDSVTTIGHGAFYYCTRLSEVTLPAGLTEISDHMFSHCGSLKSITIPESVTNIGESAFSSSGLKNIVIPEGVTVIGEWAFAWCYLDSITISSTVTGIGSSAFVMGTWGSRGPNHVYISDLEAWCGIIFEDGKANPLRCGAALYLNGEAVTELVIPEGVTTISNFAFYGSKITSITIPSSVTGIGDSAFSDCKSLTAITFAGTLEQWYTVALGEGWKESTSIKQIVCKDGTANL